MDAKHSPDQEVVLPVKGSATGMQTIVDLISASHCGLILWSRHPFEIASEFQVRLRTSALAQASLPLALLARGSWVVLGGFVVDCQPARRSDGVVGFKVSLLFQNLGAPSGNKEFRSKPCGLSPSTLSANVRLFGRN